MKKLLAFPILLLLTMNVANAQSAGTDETAIIQKVWGMAVQELTASALQLNQEEADNFWPIWNEYREKRKEVTNTKLKYIMEYADTYENMTNEKAAAIARGLLKNEKQLLKIKSKYFNKIKDKVSAIRAAQFLQVEATIDNELRTVVTENLPLVPAPKK